ncbi:MAG TPA: VWA domain-containing protein [Vicinamibacterales bacterium]|nr:VWA domain-containing protein [Vicinamibacterales bacterium]
MCCGLSAIALVASQFTSGVSLVEVYASVLDAKGEPVSGLAADDFLVEEDGQPRRIEVFTAGDLPLSLAVTVDRSFSIGRSRLAEVVRATQTLMGELRPDDRVTVLAAGSEVDVLSPLSIDHRAAYDALGALEPWGTTPLFDATVSALGAIQNASGRRALILVSDGSDRYSRATAADVLEAARARDVMTFPVALARTVPPVFAELAAVTGGRSVAAPNGAVLTASLRSMANELRRQYLLGYAPAPDDAGTRRWRSITVRVRQPGLRVRARDGYYAGR